MFDGIITQVILMVCSYSEDFSKKVQVYIIKQTWDCEL